MSRNRVVTFSDNRAYCPIGSNALCRVIGKGNPARRWRDKMKKGQCVTYLAQGGEGPKVAAMVLTAHRDGTATVKARFTLDAEGKQDGMYLGYRYRVPVSALSAEG